MTWIRWECQAPDHIVVARLAEALKVRRAEALGLFNGVCCRLGEHRPDGNLELVPDTAVEAWGQWEGKRGRFAAAFRELCIERREAQEDPIGTIKGWWRQRALLREQERSRTKPGQGTRKAAEESRQGTEEAPERPRELSPVPSRGDVDVDVDVNEQRTTPATADADPPAPEGSHVATLLTSMGRTVDRWAVFNFLERVPDPELAVWTSRLAGYLQGLDFPAGIKPTPEQLATACRDYSGSFAPVHFRAFVLRAIEGHRRPPGRRSADTTTASLDAVDRFVKGGSRAGS